LLSKRWVKASFCPKSRASLVTSLQRFDDPPPSNLLENLTNFRSRRGTEFDTYPGSRAKQEQRLNAPVDQSEIENPPKSLRADGNNLQIFPLLAHNIEAACYDRATAARQRSSLGDSSALRKLKRRLDEPERIPLQEVADILGIRWIIANTVNAAIDDVFSVGTAGAQDFRVDQPWILLGWAAEPRLKGVMPCVATERSGSPKRPLSD
jgi:hypothetical protein